MYQRTFHRVAQPRCTCQRGIQLEQYSLLQNPWMMIYAGYLHLPIGLRKKAVTFHQEESERLDVRRAQSLPGLPSGLESGVAPRGPGHFERELSPSFFVINSCVEIGQIE